MVVMGEIGVVCGGEGGGEEGWSFVGCLCCVCGWWWMVKKVSI